MSDRPVRLLIEDILESIEKIERYTAGISFEEFAGDDKTNDAVIRNLEIIGEAANRLPDEFKDQHSNIEWFKIVGLRHRIVHEYFGIDLGIVWQVVTKDMPLFKIDLQHIA
jgi:uncharacterized protein with HEPN domain